MGKSMLPKDQGLALMRKLATDDGFRSQFESDPRAAMASIGIKDDVLASLDDACFQARPLAPKEQFAELVGDSDSEQFHAAMSMYVPDIRVR